MCDVIGDVTVLEVVVVRGDNATSTIASIGTAGRSGLLVSRLLVGYAVPKGRSCKSSNNSSRDSSYMSSFCSSAFSCGPVLSSNAVAGESSYAVGISLANTRSEDGADSGVTGEKVRLSGVAHCSAADAVLLCVAYVLRAVNVTMGNVRCNNRIPPVPSSHCTPASTVSTGSRPVGEFNCT